MSEEAPCISQYGKSTLENSGETPKTHFLHHASVLTPPNPHQVGPDLQYSTNLDLTILSWWRQDCGCDALASCKKVFRFH